MGSLQRTTRIGGAARSFPQTSWTLVLEARDPSAPQYRASLERLVSLYWKPVYWTLRLRWTRPNEDAKDLTQEFFALLLERSTLSRFNRERGRFRTYLRAVLTGFMNETARRDASQKRGGTASFLRIDGEPELSLELVDRGKTAEELFDELWMKTLIEDALSQARGIIEEAGSPAFETYRRYELEGTGKSYDEVASEIGLTPHQVRRHLRDVRDLLRTILRERLRETLGSPEETDDEYRQVFRT